MSINHPFHGKVILTISELHFSTDSRSEGPIFVLQDPPEKPRSGTSEAEERVLPRDATGGVTSLFRVRGEVPWLSQTLHGIYTVAESH